MRYLVACMSVLGILFSSFQAKAQEGSDVWAWSDAGVLVTLPDQKWSLDASYHFILNDNASEYFIQFGLVGANYRFPETNVQLSAAFAYGELNDIGTVQLPQFRLRWNFPDAKWHPFVRLTYDRLMVDTFDDLPSVEDNSRYRFQAGVVPKLNSFLTLLLDTEHFIRRREGWAAEQRTDVGLDWRVTDEFHVRTIYFNRWLNFEESAERWQHAFRLSLRLFLNVPHKINRVNRN